MSAWSYLALFISFMSKIYMRKWRVLCWNVRGLNADNRQREVRAKIDESECDVICLQETKCEAFDWRLIQKNCPKKFDSFAYVPSDGASRESGILLCSMVF